jgi:SAM-dependent methyltransferase
MRWGGLALVAFLALGLCSPSGRAEEKDKVKKEDPDKFDGLVIYVPTPVPVCEKMLDMAKVTKKDVVFDLGCGDGRLLAIAAQKYGSKGVGIDIDAERIKDSKATLKKYKVEGLVELRKGNALVVPDLERATVITLYMLPEFMERLEPLTKRLKKGARIVSHDYPFPNIKEEAKIDFRGPDRNHTLYLYRIK